MIKALCSISNCLLRNDADHQVVPPMYTGNLKREGPGRAVLHTCESRSYGRNPIRVTASHLDGCQCLDGKQY